MEYREEMYEEYKASDNKEIVIAGETYYKNPFAPVARGNTDYKDSDCQCSKPLTWMGRRFLI